MVERTGRIPEGDASLVRRRLTEAMAWCSSQIALRNLLRTPELRPAHPFVLEKRRDNGTHDYEFLDTAGRAAEVESVGVRRADLLAFHRFNVTGVPLNSSQGRLLVVEINNSIWDGLSADESDGFFDVYDIPAWDTWIHLRHAEGNDALLCWVPSPLVELVGKGIFVNCTACIEWVDHLEYSVP